MIPKYRALAEEIRKNILMGVWGSDTRLMTEDEMAREYDCSRQTVRNALEVLASEGLIERRQGSGTYVSNRGIRRKPTRLIGMIATYTNYYMFPLFLDAIEQELRKNKYDMLVMATQDQVELERSILANMLMKDIDGLIVECTSPIFPNPNLDLYRQMRAKGVPIVFMNAHYYELEDSIYVQADDRGGSYRITKKLIERGYRKFGGIFKFDTHGRDRYAGCLKACMEANISLNEEDVWWFSQKESEEHMENIARQAGLDRIAELDVLVCYNDLTAMHIVSLLKRYGYESIPEIICFDNTQVLQVSGLRANALTYPAKEVGQVAVQKLINMMQGAREVSMLLPWSNE